MSDVKKSLQDILALPSLVHFDPRFMEVSSLESFLGLLYPQLKRLGVYMWNTMDGQGTVVTRQPCRLEQLE
jgi:hypothetical protein